LGREVKIGRECEIYPSYHLRRTTLGEPVIVMRGAVLEAMLGYVRDAKRPLRKISQVASWSYEDDVNWGHSTTTGSCSDETRIGRGTKIDTWCHIGTIAGWERTL